MFQNSDHGWIDGGFGDVAVLQVTRKQSSAVHFLHSERPLEVGTKVKQRLDWARRFDNMQQHSGQHLVSAFFERILGINTTSWWMAENNGDRVGF